MMANELEPSTLDPLTPASAPALKTGIGAKAACPAIFDFEASLESLYWNNQFTAKADWPAIKLSRTAFSSEETELGLRQAIIDRLLHPGEGLNTFIIIESRFATCIRK